MNNVNTEDYVQGILELKGYGAYFFFTLDLLELGVDPIEFMALCTLCGDELNEARHLLNIAIKLHEDSYEIHLVTEKPDDCDDCIAISPEKYTSLKSALAKRERYQREHVMKDILPNMKDFKHDFCEYVGIYENSDLIKGLCAHNEKLLKISTINDRVLSGDKELPEVLGVFAIDVEELSDGLIHELTYACHKCDKPVLSVRFLNVIAFNHSSSGPTLESFCSPDSKKCESCGAENKFVRKTYANLEHLWQSHGSLAEEYKEGMKIVPTEKKPYTQSFFEEFKILTGREPGETVSWQQVSEKLYSHGRILGKKVRHVN